METLNFAEEPVPIESGLRKTFSKEHAQNLRNQTASEIRRIRGLPTSSKNSPDEIRNYYNLRETYDQLQANIILRILDRSNYRNLEAIYEQKAQRRKEELIEETQKRFERDLDTILGETPLSLEEQEKYLSEPAMMEMSQEDFLEVSRRLSGKFVTHVTRQGVRENTFAYHSKGRGDFHNNFVDILQGSRTINSLVSQLESESGLANRVLTDLVNWLVETGKDDQDIEEFIVKHFLEEEIDSEPGDKYSSHFGSNEVISDLYGGEKGYDIFFYYPAEFIAYNYQHKTRGMAPFDKSSDRGRNDVLVWNEGKGVPVDASMVCIPSDVLVNPKTGSQYELDEKNIPILDSEGKLVLSREQITSQEYWENFFRQNKQLAPNKIVFYPRLDHPSHFGRYRGKDYEDMLFEKSFRRTAELEGVQDQKSRVEKIIRKQVKNVLTKVRSENGLVTPSP